MNVIFTFPLTQLCQLHWSEIPHSIVLLLRKHNWLYLALGIVCVNLFKRICKPDRFTVYCVSSRPRVKYYFWRPPVTYFERFSNHCSHSGHCTGLIWLSHFLPQDQKCMLHISRIPHLTTQWWLFTAQFLSVWTTLLCQSTVHGHIDEALAATLHSAFCIIILVTG